MEAASDLSVPVDRDELTAEWFTDVLRANRIDTTVTAVEVLDAHSGTTGRVRVALSYGGTSCPDGAPGQLFVKLAPFDEEQRGFIRFTGIGESEARFYATAARDVPVRIPAVWHAAVDADRRYVMVLEDLLASGCRFPPRHEADDEERARSTVEELALLHAAFWESPRFTDDLAWVPERAGLGRFDNRDEEATAAAWLVRRALDRFADDLPSVFRRSAELYVSRTAEILDLWDRGERTLVHGDCHIGNLFVDGARTGFYDWAMVSRSPAVRDLAYTCSYSMEPSVRRGLEADLIDLYRSTLADHGVQLAHETVIEQYRIFALFGWVSATSTAVMGTRWQPEELAYGAMERATATLADLDTVEAIESRLR